MATTFFQKLRIGLRGWNRRRAEAAAKRKAEFLAQETSWAPAAPQERPLTADRATRKAVDLEGLQVAYLDNSGRIQHYLDRDTGDILDLAEADEQMKQTVAGAPARYRRIPQRSPESEAADREAFLGTVEKPAIRRALEVSRHSAAEFRKVLAADRAVERAWYNFKNRRAAEAIEEWLASL